MKTWAKLWNRSKIPRKQRKYRYNAPLHIRHKLMSVNLSKDLRKRYGIRNIPSRKGDRVQVLRGQFKSKSGQINKISLKELKVYIDGIENIRRDGTKTLYPFNPSNLRIIELNIDDKKRKIKLRSA